MVYWNGLALNAYTKKSFSKWPVKYAKYLENLFMLYWIILPWYVKTFIKIYLGNDTHMTSTFRGWWVKWKMRCYQTNGVREVAIVLDVQSLLFFVKENWICSIIRHWTSKVKVLDVGGESGGESWKLGNIHGRT